MLYFKSGLFLLGIYLHNPKFLLAAFEKAVACLGILHWMKCRKVIM